MKRTPKQMFQHADVTPIVNSGNGNGHDAKIEKMAQEYAAWRKSCETKTLAEVLKLSGIVETTSPKGFPAIAINDGASKPIFVRYTFAAVNAALDFYKYRVLETDEHIAWFDPDAEGEAVRSTFHRFDLLDSAADDAETGEWRFWDWKDECFQRSVLDGDLTVRPGDEKTGLKAWKEQAASKRFNMVRKHYVLNQMLRAKRRGKTFLAVFNSKEDEEHWQVCVKDLLEEPYIKALEAEAGRAEEARQNRTVRKGYDQPTNQNVQDLHSPTHKKLLQEIVELRGLVLVKIKWPNRETPWERTFDPSTNVEQVNYCKSLPPKAEIVEYEVLS